MVRSRVLAVLAAAALTSAFGGCAQGSTAEQESRTDVEVRTFGEDLGYARTPDAAALARLALERGKDRGYVVLDATDVETSDPQKVSKQLVLRVPSKDEENYTERVCYRLSVNYYALVGRPKKIACPPDATPYVPPPAPAEVKIPVEAPWMVRRALRAGGTAEVLQDRLDRAMASALRGEYADPPLVRVGTDPTGVGVGVYGGPGACLLGRAIGRKVEVWYLDATQAMPGELSCDPPTALSGLGQKSPR